MHVIVRVACVGAVGTSMRVAGSEAGRQSRVDICTCLEFDIGCLNLDGSANIRMLTRCASRLTRGEYWSRVSGVGSRGRQRRDRVGDRGGRRYVTTRQCLDRVGRLLLLLLLLENRIVAKTVSF